MRTKQSAKKSAVGAAKEVAAKPKASAKKAAPKVKEKVEKAAPKVKAKAEKVAKTAVKKVSPKKSQETESASETVGKYVGESVDSVINAGAALLQGKSPFAGGRAKVSFLEWLTVMVVVLSRHTAVVDAFLLGRRTSR